jgi:homeobox protein goosecoid-like
MFIINRIENNRNFYFIVPPQGRRRRQRTVFSQNNVQQLDSVFMHNQYPDIELRETLAAQMGVPESRIQVNS